MTRHEKKVPFVARDDTGDFTLDSDLVAERFGWSAQQLNDLMRRGLVASRVERGEGEDAGQWRLSLRSGNRRWFAVIGPDGSIVEERMEYVRV